MDRQAPQAGVLRRLARHRAMARAILWFERGFVALWPAIVICLAFLVLALAGLFTLLPPWPHVLVLAGFGVALLASLVRAVVAWRRPTPAEADRWLENAAGLKHGPLSVLDDRPSRTDPAALALWHAHVARMTALLGRLRLRLPHPRIAEHDKRAVRAGLALLLLVTWVAAGDEAWPRLAEAFQPSISAAVAGPSAEVAAWITPPAYTGLAPLFLRGSTAVSVPAGSHLMISVTGGSGEPTLAYATQKLPSVLVGPQSWQAETDLNDGGTLSVRRHGSTLGQWTVATVVDMPPEARFPAPPNAVPRSRELRLPWATSDDYGVTSLTAEIRLRDRPTAPPLEVKIPLNGTPKEAHGATQRDLTAHPWAGLDTTVTLVARDALGQAGQSDTLPLVLPQRVFRHPLAQALIEVRKALSLRPQDRGPAVTALRMLAARGDLYDNDAGVAVNLGAIEGMLRHGHAPDTIDRAQSMMWTLALALEEGAVQRTARALQQARQALRDTLDRQQREAAQAKPNDPRQQQRNAELDKRTQELRDAIQKHLQALLDQAKRDHTVMPFDPQAQHLTMRDLDQMLQNMQQAAKEGRMQDAQQQMAELEKLLQQLQQAENASPQERRAAQQAQRQRGQQQMSAVQDLVQRERALRDQAQARNRPQSGAPQSRAPQSDSPQAGAPQPQSGANANADTSQRQTDNRVQKALRRALGELMQQYGDMAGDVPKPLSDADQAMQQASEALAASKDSGAAAAAQRAVDALQKGGQQMGQQMAQQFGVAAQPGQEGQAEGQDSADGGQDDQYGDGTSNNTRPGTDQQRQENGTRDPLGRLTQQGSSGGDEGEDVALPDQMEQGRTRAIQDELRRRGAERTRPTQELNYIDRLLQAP